MKIEIDKIKASSGEYSEMTMTTVSNEVKIGLTGEVVIIDWGDGTENGGYRDVKDEYFTHTYPDASARTITITGKNITCLDCNSENGNRIKNKLTSLDVSKNAALTELNCEGNLLTSLDVSRAITLKELNCAENQLTSLDVSNNSALIILDCNENQLTSLEVSNNSVLQILYCADNQLEVLDVSKNTKLEELNCTESQIKKLDISGATALKELFCGLNKLTSLDVSKNTALTKLYCFENQLTSIDVSKNTTLDSWNWENQNSHLYENEADIPPLNENYPCNYNGEIARALQNIVTAKRYFESLQN